jgi:hypothetical protein
MWNLITWLKIEIAMYMLAELPFYSLSDYDLIKLFKTEKYQLDDLTDNQAFQKFIQNVHTNSNYQQLNFDYCKEDQSNSQIV